MDAAMLDRHRRFEDHDGLIAEEFLRPTIGGARTVAVLTRPARPSAGTGWVVCPGFGEEQAHGYRLEVMASRALGRAGFPVLRFHAQGYGDSERPIEHVSLGSHLADAADAVSVLREHAGVEAVGIAGAWLGGTIAALTADRLELALMALWQPVCDGASYLRSVLRSVTLARLAGRGKVEGSSQPEEEELRRRLSQRGWVDVNGFPLSARAAEELDGVDLLRDLGRFRGRSLVVGITRSGRVGESLRQLVGRLEDLGGRSELSVVTSAQAAWFGRSRTGGGIDLAFELEGRVAGDTAEWARRAVRGTHRA